MIQLSDRLLAMEESATIAMAKKSRELKALGKDIISLSLGEPDFYTPAFIKEQLHTKIAESYLKIQYSKTSSDKIDETFFS